MTGRFGRATGASWHGRFAVIIAGRRGKASRQRRRRNWEMIVGVGILVLMAVIAIAAPLIAPDNPSAMHPNMLLTGPSSHFLLGTDDLGRDVLSRLIFGARTSLAIGFAAGVIAAVIGVPVGLWAGYHQGWGGNLTMRVVDVLLGFPGIIIIMVISLIVQRNLSAIVVAIGFLLSPVFVRVARAVTISEREEGYVEAVRSLGAGSRYILLNAVLRNGAGPLLVQFALSVANAILLEAGLSFLGLGVQPPTPSWGLMIQEGSAYLSTNALISVVPGIGLVVIVLALNLSADSIARRRPRSAGRSKAPAGAEGTGAASGQEIRGSIGQELSS